MIRKILMTYVLFLISFFCISNLPAQTPATVSKEVTTPSVSLVKAKKLLEQGRSSLVESPLSLARQAFESCADADDTRFDCEYQLAMTYHYLGVMYEMNHKRDDAKKSVDLALVWAEKASKLDDQSADIHSLLAQLYGQKISYGDLFTGINCGPKADEENKKAFKLDPDNPRVQSTMGRQCLMAPPIMGGDVKKSVKYFLRSIELDPKSDETYYWLAKAYRKLNDRINFKKALDMSLSLNSKNILAQKELLDWK